MPRSKEIWVEAVLLFQATLHISENVAGHLKGKLMQINCKNMSIDKALRLLRKKVEADGLMQELKSREYYEKPSKKRNRLKQAAIRRNKKK